MSKKAKSILFVAFEILALAGVFFFWIQSESDSVSVHWQKILPWVAGGCGALFVGGIVWYASTRQQN